MNTSLAATLSIAAIIFVLVLTSLVTAGLIYFVLSYCSQMTIPFRDIFLGIFTLTLLFKILR